MGSWAQLKVGKRKGVGIDMGVATGSQTKAQIFSSVDIKYLNVGYLCLNYGLKAVDVDTRFG